jgi:phenylpyruvate tautomerase PptA (4-oxalocrotonate tautomerase family)
MPYIQVSLSHTLNPEQKEAVKAELGSLITLIPGKTEAVTMVRIEDGCALYKGGKALNNGAFVEVRLYGKSPAQSEERFTEAVFEMLGKQLGIEPGDVYLNILEMERWGTRGHLK